MAIATDNVDYEMVTHPRKWDIKFIARFMIIFGLVSSLIDYITILIFVYGLKVGESKFQTIWFIISVVSELFILFVIRTRKVFFKSKSSKFLLIGSLITFTITIILPFIPKINTLLGFTPISWVFFLTAAGLLILYIVITEITKKIFYRYSKY